MPLLETKGAASAQGFGLTSGGAAPVYVDDVFSTWLYDGNGSTQTITNGIDLSGKGGLVWLKERSSSASGHAVFDTARSTVSGDPFIQTNTTGGDVGGNNNYIDYLSTGFTLNLGAGGINISGTIYTSWTFRKQPKFFDVVTYTGTGANRTVAHSLGSVPGCIIVKRTDVSADWQVYHRSNANTEYMVLNSTAAKATGTTRWNSTTPTATEFSLGTDTTVNANTGTYVAYLFAHDAGGFGASGSDNVISCGSYTGNGLADGPTITLGYEPQWLMIKRSAGGVEDWVIIDNMRGMVEGTANEAILIANGTNAEVMTNRLSPLATGFQLTDTGAAVNASGSTYIYIAIRRPNKPPTTGTQVFTPTVYTGTNVDNRLVNTTTLADMVWVRQRDSTTVAGMVVGDRLWGQPYLLTGSTAAEVNDADSFDAQLVSAVEYGTAFSSMNGFWVGNDPTSQLNASTTSNNQIAEAFKRAPGFFDVVCYTGTGVARTVAHNLTVAPELVFIKQRDGGGGNWFVGSQFSGTGYNYSVLNSASSGSAFLYTDNVVYSAAPTATLLNLSNSGGTNGNTQTYVAYLFASLPGISKVGSYTGNGGTVNTNGTSQTINCGFTAGARFVLIKRTDSIGNWFVFDSARGIVAASDPYVLLNSTAAEVTSVDAVDTDNSGFIVNQTSGTNLNVTGGTYIFLSIS